MNKDTPRTSGGSVWKPSGCWPCSMSNRACKLRKHREGCEKRVSFISSNTPHSPMPMIWRKENRELLLDHILHQLLQANREKDIALLYAVMQVKTF